MNEPKTLDQIKQNLPQRMVSKLQRIASQLDFITKYNIHNLELPKFSKLEC